MLWLLLTLLLILAWAALRFLPAGADGHMPLPYLIALIPYLWIPSLACAVAASMIAQWWLFAVALLITALLACSSWPYWKNRFPFEWLKSRHAVRHTAANETTVGETTADASATDDSATAATTTPAGATLISVPSKAHPTSTATQPASVSQSATAASHRSTASSSESGAPATVAIQSAPAAQRETSTFTTASAEPPAPANASMPFDPSRTPLARFTVMTVNCRYGRASAEGIVAAVRTHCVAVLALQELTRDLVDELDASGISLLLPYRHLGEDKISDNGGFNGIWTRFEAVTAQTSTVDIPAADVPSFTIAFPQPIPAYEFDVADTLSEAPGESGDTAASSDSLAVSEDADASFLAASSESNDATGDSSDVPTRQGDSTTSSGASTEDDDAGDSSDTPINSSGAPVTSRTSVTPSRTPTGSDGCSAHPDIATFSGDIAGQTDASYASDDNRTIVDDDAYDRGTVAVTFASAHTKSPMRGCRYWSDGIIGLGELVRQRHDDTMPIHYETVVLGDLNASLDHPSFRKLLAAGFQDANLTVAQGVAPTFPSWLPWPRIVLDHVLTTPRIAPIHVESFPIEGTDHLALTAALVVHP